MLVSCKFNTGAEIPASSRSLGESEETEFSPLKIGSEYLVFSILSISGNLYFLVCGENEKPLWVPNALFVMIDSRIPDGWGLCITSAKEDYKILKEQLNIEAIFGYEELINEYFHYIGLLERDDRELLKFYREKTRVETWWDRVQSRTD